MIGTTSLAMEMMMSRLNSGQLFNMVMFTGKHPGMRASVSFKKAHANYLLAPSKLSTVKVLALAMRQLEPVMANEKRLERDLLLVGVSYRDKKTGLRIDPRTVTVVVTAKGQKLFRVEKRGPAPLPPKQTTPIPRGGI